MQQIARHFQLVSPPMPTGSTWLVNILLELGVRSTNYASHWLESDAGSTPADSEALEVMRWHLPALHRYSHFRFEPELEVFYDHRLSYAQYPARRTILFARDLRDTIFSHMVRQLHYMDLEWTPANLFQRLAQPEVWKQYFPHLFDLPAPETLAYFYFFWLQQPPEQLLVVRFEDSKTDPEREVRRVLAFLGIERPKAVIERAVEASQFKHFQALREAMEASTCHLRYINRKGISGEWRQVLPAESQADYAAFFAGPAAQALAALGYTSDPVAPLPAAQALERHLQQDSWFALLGWLQQALLQAGEAQLPLLSGQLLALLWTQSIFGPAQVDLPSARRAAQRLCALCAQDSSRPALLKAALKALNPEHPLHQPAQETIWRADPEQPLELALSAARAAGRPYLLWQRASIRLEAAGLQQLVDLLDGRHPGIVAAVPTFCLADSEREFRRQAWQQHAAWGAEFRAVTLPNLPPCLVLRTDLSLADGNWPCHQALGVLAAQISGA